MLTNDDLNAIEQHEYAGETTSAEVLALVGELRAERTRTETLRAALRELIVAAADDSFPEDEGASWQGRFDIAITRAADLLVDAALAASVEEPRQEAN